MRAVLGCLALGAAVWSILVGTHSPQTRPDYDCQGYVVRRPGHWAFGGCCGFRGPSRCCVRTHWRDRVTAAGNDCLETAADVHIRVPGVQPKRPVPSITGLLPTISAVSAKLFPRRSARQGALQTRARNPHFSHGHRGHTLSSEDSAPGARDISEDADDAHNATVSDRSWSAGRQRAGTPVKQTLGRRRHDRDYVTLGTNSSISLRYYGHLDSPAAPSGTDDPARNPGLGTSSTTPHSLLHRNHYHGLNEFEAHSSLAHGKIFERENKHINQEQKNSNVDVKNPPLDPKPRSIPGSFYLLVVVPLVSIPLLAYIVLFRRKGGLVLQSPSWQEHNTLEHIML